MEVYASLGTCGKHTCTHWGVQEFGDSDISKALPHILTITVLQEDGDLTVSKEMIPKNLHCNYSNEGPIQQRHSSDLIGIFTGRGRHNSPQTA